MLVRITQGNLRHMLVRLLLVAILIQCGSAGLYSSAAAPAEATEPSASGWERMGQAGRMVRWLAASPTSANQVFAAVDHVDGGGVFRSTDGGRSWESAPLFGNQGLTNREVQTVAVCPSGQLFAGTWGGGVFRAEANSWTPANGSIGSPYVTALSCDSLGRLYAGTANQGVYRSTNAGQSWSAANAGLDNRTILTVRSQGARILAGTEAGAFSSTNGGDSWNPAGLSGQRVFDFEFDPTNPQRLWAATTTAGIFTSWDGGATWSPVGAPLEAYAIARDVDGRLYAGTRADGLYRLISGQWVPQPMAARKVYYLRAFGDPWPRIVAATNDGIWTPPFPQLFASLRNNPASMVPNGSQLTYYIDYWGEGIGVVSNVIVTNRIPAGTVLVAGSITPAGAGPSADGVITWQLDRVDPVTDRGTLSYSVRTCVAIDVAVNPPGAGSITFPPPNCPGSNRYLPGVALNIAASTIVGYPFREWTATTGNLGNAGAAQTTFVPGNADAVLTAHFEVWTPTPTETPIGTPTATPTATRTPWFPPFITRTATPTSTPEPPTATPTLSEPPTATSEPPTPTPTETTSPTGLLGLAAGIPQQAAQVARPRESALVVMGVTSAHPVINTGATVTWHYAGIQYQVASNSVVNGIQVYLPIILR